MFFVFPQVRTTGIVTASSVNLAKGYARINGRMMTGSVFHRSSRLLTGRVLLVPLLVHSLAEGASAGIALSVFSMCLVGTEQEHAARHRSLQLPIYKKLRDGDFAQPRLRGGRLAGPSLLRTCSVAQRTGHHKMLKRPICILTILGGLRRMAPGV